MKKSFLVFFFFSISLNFFAQTSASASGIAVQGIARDANNTALSDKTITFKFNLYYKDPSEKTIFTENTSITTDAFGVFSHVMNVDPSTNANFSNYSVYLKIEDLTSTGTLISDELFKHVPYAISANNGVPTGSIMPYVGTVAPEGWVICDGRSLTTINGSDELIKLVGTNVPNLGGMFLRGAGQSVYGANSTGPSLKQFQSDAYEKHLHGKGSLSTSTKDLGNLPNSSKFWSEEDIRTNTDTGAFGPYEAVTTKGVIVNTSGIHNHTINGSTSNAGSVSETRPVNYGVNYIIKL
jgi:microcystin-dependent protein